LENLKLAIYKDNTPQMHWRTLLGLSCTVRPVGFSSVYVGIYRNYQRLRDSMRLRTYPA